jgi:predicted nucleic acid-binding protein
VIGYLDTSAMVPLLIAEPTSPACRRFWDDADAVVTNRLLYVEAAAALAQAHRMGRLVETHLDNAMKLLDRLWDELDVIEVDEPLVLTAAGAARTLGLRGYDAVHCVSAHQISDTDLVAAAGDRRLLEAWHQLGIATYDVHQPI